MTFCYIQVTPTSYLTLWAQAYLIALYFNILPQQPSVQFMNICAPIASWHNYEFHTCSRLCDNACHMHPGQYELYSRSAFCGNPKGGGKRVYDGWCTLSPSIDCIPQKVDREYRMQYNRICLPNTLQKWMHSEDKTRACLGHKEHRSCSQHVSSFAEHLEGSTNRTAHRCDAFQLTW